MVKISQEMLLNHTRQTKRRTNETAEQFLKRLTHLYLQERNIEEIDNLSLCRSLSVLYLYNNEIKVIQNLSFASNLTHLYLQKNKISQISGLKYLQRLTKLYIGHNSITVVEGLDCNVCLSELHVEQQTLPDGEKLLFDPRTLAAISGSLTILNISGNNIDELCDLKVLRRLNQLIAEDNKLDNWKDISETLLDWKYLHQLNISANPLCSSKEKKWRDKLIIMSKSLVIINKKEVTESTRLFVQSWHAKKEERRRARRESKSKSKMGLVERNSDGYMMTQHTSLDEYVGSVHNKLLHNNNNEAYMPSLEGLEREELPPLEPHEVHKYQYSNKGLPPILNATGGEVGSGYSLRLQPDG